MRILQDGTKIVWEPLAGSQTLSLTCPANIIVFHGTRGPGKCFPLNTQVPTPSGWMLHGDLQVGDLVFGSNGKPIKVSNVYHTTVRPVYRMVFVDGSIIDSSDNHNWTVTIDYGAKKTWRKMSTFDIKARVDKGYPVQMQSRTHVEYPEQPTTLDPYLLGAYIGDGCSNTYIRKSGGTNKYVGFGSVDKELIDHFLEHGFYGSNSKDGFTWITGKVEVYNKLMSLGLVGKLTFDKFIPDEILYNSFKVRLAFLQGLCDTDGGIANRGTCADISTSNEKLKDQILQLVRSLGCKATVAYYVPKANAKQKAPNWMVRFNHPTIIPFRLLRKIKLYTCLTKRMGFFLPKVKSVELIGEQLVSCISVDAEDSTYIVGKDFLKSLNTDAQLMRFRRNVGQGYGRYWRGIIFDREYKNLDDLVSKSMRWFPEFKDGARFLSSKSDYRWVWPTGEELLFRAIKKDTDYWGYHGQEFPFIGWNELTKYPTDSLFEMLMSCNRSSFLTEEHPMYHGDDTNPYFLPEIPLEVFATTNPHGVGHNWVKKRFINPGKPGQIVRKTINVFNPRTQQREDVVKTQTHIFGSYRENRYLSPQYVAELESITDPNKRRAWLFGDWDIVAGGMFDDYWDPKIHVLEPFDIPSNWRIDRSYDHGESRPFSVGWWAESDGSDVRLSNGQWKSTVKGDLFRIDEWYGWTGKSNQGLRMLSTDIAAGIVEREVQAGVHSRVQPGPADNSIWDVANGNSIAADMARPIKIDGKRYKGVTWLRSDKSAGSRTAGWKQLRQFLKDAIPVVKKDPVKGDITLPREKPGLFVFNTCVMFIELFPIAPRDELKPDDVDTDSEDHIADEARYKALSTESGTRGGRTQGM